MFKLDRLHYQKYGEQNVGGNIHNELWVLSEKLPVFNAHIVGKIKMVKAFFGTEFIMPAHTGLNKELSKFKRNEI